MTLGDQVIRALRQRATVLPFHADWIKAAFADDIQVAALSCPRGSAKTWIAGQLGVLACGALARSLAQGPPRPLWRYHGMAG